MDKAAVTVQAAFRGFLVRQCQPLRKLRQIADVRTKLKKLNMRACDPSYIDKLCSDPMENRKVKEEIMALLLELDAIQGVLPVVRKIRKSVTRDVVQFQEIVDAIQVDAVPRNDAEEVNPRPSGQANSRASELANPRASVSVNPPLRRVMSLDDNVYPEQSYTHRANKKKPSDGTAGDGSNRSSDEDVAPRRRPEGWGKRPLLQRSMSGNHRTSANKAPMLARTFSEVPKNAGVRNPLLARSISELVRKPTSQNPLLGRSISEVQRKKSDAVNASPAATVLDGHRSPYPKTPPISDDRGSSVDANLPPAQHKVISFDREEAAIRIQSTFRGHLSRRSRPLQHMRTISVVNIRLRELNRLLADPICAERLRMDKMERLKWSEEITALLLKLDSVQGVVQAIRDIRKSVTREVIKLQEEVDCIIHEADILSRVADIQSDSSAASTEQFNLDQESLDKNVGEQVVNSYRKSSPSFDVIMGNGHVQAQHYSNLWDDKFMDLQKPVNFQQGLDGSTASCRCEKAGIEAEGKQRPLVRNGEVDCRHHSLARMKKKLKRIDKERAKNGTLTCPVIPDLDSSAAGHQDSLTKDPNGYVEKPLEAVMNGINQALEAPPSGIPTTMGCCPHTSVHSTPVTSMRTSEESSPFPRQLDKNSNVGPMLPDENLHSNREHRCRHNGRSPPLFSPCGQHLPEERACEFLRSRAGHCQCFGSGLGKVSNGYIAQEDHRRTTSNAPAVHQPLADQWEAALMDENARLKLLLSQVLEHAEDQAHDLKLTKRRLAILEKERVQHTKKEDTAVRRKNTAVWRRR